MKVLVPKCLFFANILGLPLILAFNAIALDTGVGQQQQSQNSAQVGQLDFQNQSSQVGQQTSQQQSNCQNQSSQIGQQTSQQQSSYQNQSSQGQTSPSCNISNIINDDSSDSSSEEECNNQTNVTGQTQSQINQQRAQQSPWMQEQTTAKQQQLQVLTQECQVQRPSTLTCERDQTPIIRGANFNSVKFLHRSQKKDHKFLKNSPNMTLYAWQIDRIKIGHKHTYRKWNGSTWTDVLATNMWIHHINLYGVNWNNVSLQGKFRHLHFRNSLIANTTFIGAYSDIDFRETTLMNVLFQNVSFDSRHGNYSSFDNATLDGVHFENCNFSGTIFRKSKFRDVTIASSSLTNTVYFKGVKVWTGTKWLKLTRAHLVAMASYLGQHRGATFNLNTWASQLNQSQSNQSQLKH